ncbi:MAG TPA: hypothetical protein VEH81_05530, partial [Ktedonobacteraceae bacterium]|nr:hypothetical protein [Ktedonobacteraceae bacterium]
WPVGVLELMGQVSFLTFFLLFPSGRFVPRWTRWGVILIIVLEAHYIFLTNPLLASKSGPFDFLAFAFLAISVVVLQVYRYSRVSTFRERQQTKWVVFGFSLAIVGFVSVSLLFQLLVPQETLHSPVFGTLVSTTINGILLLLIPISETIPIVV